MNSCGAHPLFCRRIRPNWVNFHQRHGGTLNLGISLKSKRGRGEFAAHRARGEPANVQKNHAAIQATYMIPVVSGTATRRDELFPQVLPFSQGEVAAVSFRWSSDGSWKTMPVESDWLPPRRVLDYESGANVAPDKS